MDMKKLGRKSFIWCTVVHGRAGWKQRDKNQPPLISEKDALAPAVNTKNHPAPGETDQNHNLLLPELRV